jgi:branched-chain amino acid transport system permease protein
MKIVVFLISAVLAAVSGWLYAHRQRFVNPTPFGLDYGSSSSSWRWSAAPVTSGVRCSAPA